MAKEIFEQPAAVERTLLGHSTDLASCWTNSDWASRSCGRVGKVLRGGLRHRLPLRTGREIRDRTKELAYMHADGFAAVELKHGPIALIENGLPVVVTMPSPKSRPILHCKMLSDVREIGPRRLHHHPRRGIRRHGGPFRGLPDRTPQGARIVPAVGRDHTDAIIAAEIARSRGYDIDKPRNLAKSVTVE